MPPGTTAPSWGSADDPTRATSTACRPRQPTCLPLVPTSQQAPILPAEGGLTER